MHALWIDAGNDADYQRLHKYGITEPIYDIRDPRITKEYLRNVSNLGFQPGVYAAWNWLDGLSGAEFAEWVEAKVKPLNISQNRPSVHLNDESKDPDRIVELLERWRQLRPSKRTVWTLEGLQGGLFADEHVQRINATNVLIGPQCYTGQMLRMESATVVLDLVRRGFDASRIWPFLDAAQLGGWWEGTAYTQGRLPQ